MTRLSRDVSRAVSRGTDSVWQPYFTRNRPSVLSFTLVHVVSHSVMLVGVWLLSKYQPPLMVQSLPLGTL